MLSAILNKTKDQPQEEKVKHNEMIEKSVSPLMKRALERQSDTIPEASAPLAPSTLEEPAPPATLTRTDSVMSESKPSRFGRWDELPDRTRTPIPSPRGKSNARQTWADKPSSRATRERQSKQRVPDRDDARVIPAQTPDFSPSLKLSRNLFDRNQKLRVLTGNSSNPPNVDRTVVGSVKPVKEWRLMPLSAQGTAQSDQDASFFVLIKDTRRCYTTLTRHMDPWYIGKIESLVESTGLRPNSPIDFFTGNPVAEEIIAEMLVRMSKASAADVKVREPDPTKDLVSDEHIQPYVPCSLGQFNWPVYSQVPEICVTTEFSANENIAIYQKWVIGHEHYTPLGFPYIQRFIPSVNPDGVQPYSFEVHGISGKSRSMEANHSGVIISCFGDHLEGIYDDKIKQQTELANAHILELNLHALATTLSK
jgi:hypothetical protein